MHSLAVPAGLVGVLQQPPPAEVDAADTRLGWVMREQQWLMRPLARWYQNNVSHELSKYGE